MSHWKGVQHHFLPPTPSFWCLYENPELHCSLYPLVDGNPRQWTQHMPAVHCDSGSLPCNITVSVLERGMGCTALCSHISDLWDEQMTLSAIRTIESCCNILGGESRNNQLPSLPEKVMWFYALVGYFAGWCSQLLVHYFEEKISSWVYQEPFYACWVVRTFHWLGYCLGVLTNPLSLTSVDTSISNLIKVSGDN